MNHCVVIARSAANADGGAYPGPMGAVLDASARRVAPSRDLPFACTMNGRCAEVSPVDSPLPTLLALVEPKPREGLEGSDDACRLGALGEPRPSAPPPHRVASGDRRARHCVFWVASRVGIGIDRRSPVGGPSDRTFPVRLGSTFMEVALQGRAARDRSVSNTSARDSIRSAVRAGLGGSPNDPAAIAAEAAALWPAQTIRPPPSNWNWSLRPRKVRGSGRRWTGSGASKRFPLAVGAYSFTVKVCTPRSSSACRGSPRSGLGRGPNACRRGTGLRPARPGFGTPRYRRRAGRLSIHPQRDADFASILPLHHIAGPCTATDLPIPADHAASVGGRETSPRNAILITGPSGTTDIEGSYVRERMGPDLCTCFSSMMYETSFGHSAKMPAADRR